MFRPDIAAAVDATPERIRGELGGSAAKSLDILNTHLSSEEEVRHITSAATDKDRPANCILAITNRRLIFVAPAPQALGFRLSTLTKAQVYAGYVFVEGDFGKYSFGLAADEWGENFEGLMREARASAVLSCTD
jgi:hypothetical protein